MILTLALLYVVAVLVVVVVGEVGQLLNAMEPITTRQKIENFMR